MKKLDDWKQQIKYWKEKHGLDHKMHLSESNEHPIMPQAVVQHVYNITNGDAFITQMLDSTKCLQLSTIILTSQGNG